MKKSEYAAYELERLKREGLYRSITPLSSAQEKYVDCGGRRMLMLASNSYLDMCARPELKAAAKVAVDGYGAGSGGSRLTTGSTKIHGVLEKELAAFKGHEDCVLFNTGYMANAGVIGAVCPENGVVFSDSLNHASIIDGCRLSRRRVVVYEHCNMRELEQKIIESKAESGMIVTDGVFSMDGDIAPLDKICALGDKYNLFTMTDDAHATGVIGRTGRGTEEHFGVKADISMGTLSKAFGSEGGFVCTAHALAELVRNRARSFIFTTAPPCAAVGAALAAVRILRDNPGLCARVRSRARYLCERLAEYGVPAHSESAIVPIPVGDETAAVRAAQRLRDEGIFISAIRYPTVAKGAARLRAAVMATHTNEELDFAAQMIAKAIVK